MMMMMLLDWFFSFRSLSDDSHIFIIIIIILHACIKCHDKVKVIAIYAMNNEQENKQQPKNIKRDRKPE